ncbi:alpha/beta hydrolase family protein [Klugiella xanthotipulae]|uniref:Prolyl oligopeptidase family protein n=1 Tax=Klugiella xanthotipulae TaxID=244735 RepID=A0A543I716_9MICO|nr:prolyl oligopeptidase family serine peptidase [Klugiella xanthotipulae]TQM66396.1 prolyl oligopeptidase family protein [Klugiella xanthotipulae]
MWFPSDTHPAPLVLLWHGGFWRSLHDRAHVAPLAADLVRRGCVVAVFEYRRTGAGGDWSHTFQDVAAGADALPGLIEAAFPGRVDSQSIVYLGHSAGGQMALWAAVRHRLPGDAAGWRLEPPRVSRVVAIAPVTDLAAAFDADLGAGAVAELIGGSPAQYPERYAGIDPARLPAPDVPTWLVHGDADDRVPVAMSRAYTRTHLGGRPQQGGLDTVPGVDHFQVITPPHPAWERVVAHLIPPHPRPHTTSPSMPG